MAFRVQGQGQEQDPSFLLEALYCEEEKWEDEDGEDGEDGEDEEGVSEEISENPSFSSSPLFLLDQDLFWEDEELISLFAREQQNEQIPCPNNDIRLSSDRQEAVDWILRVKSFYRFTTLTAVLAINYLDRFLCSYGLQRDKPWMIQLVAVACLSLAAKVEETQVPLLLDLQVEETKYVFEAKTIQRMELLILSTLRWKMHSITPISFLDHIIRRLGLKNDVHWNFLRGCESLLLSVVSDSKFVGYLPSVLAAATMMHVIEQVELFDPYLYQNQLLDVLKLSKEKVRACYNLILERPFLHDNAQNENPNLRKRKNCYESAPSSPSCAIDSKLFSSENSDDSWCANSYNHYYPSSVCSSPEPPLKKIRGAQEEKKPMRLSWVIVASP